MSRRRKRQSGDSLELLLDTICNTFGGVLFIALLVTILLQMAGGNPAASQRTIAPEVIESLIRQQNQLIAEICGPPWKPPTAHPCFATVQPGSESHRTAVFQTQIPVQSEFTA